MKITTISLSRTIPTGPYMNDKITMEVSLHPGDSHATVLDNLSHLIDEWHKKAHPHLYQSINDGPNIQTKPNAPYTIPEPLIINIQDEKTQIAIENAQSLDELNKIKEDNPVMTVEIFNQYNKRMDELTNESNTSFTNGLD